MGDYKDCCEPSCCEPKCCCYENKCDSKGDSSFGIIILLIVLLLLFSNNDKDCGGPFGGLFQMIKSSKELF